MTQIPIPTSTEPVVDQQTGHMRPAWRTFFEAFRKRFATAESDLAERPVTKQEEFGSWLIPSPEDKDYRLVVNIPWAFTITDVTTVCVSGTCTATAKIGSTALGGTANSVSSTEQTQTHDSDNEMAAGDDLVLTISDNSSCVDLTITIAGTRTLATS